MRRNREQRQPVESGVLGQSPLKPELATLIREGQLVQLLNDGQMSE